ncbi:hypothetical protein BSY17_60 [Sphingobium sp. RAC03]|nr:hypothetical protein BSY17_60 [Sphingobium sp. RAC03]
MLILVQNDSRRLVRVSHRACAVARWLSGAKQITALHYSRREALRRGTVLFRFAYRLSEQAESDLRGHGFNDAQFALLTARFCSQAPARRDGRLHA